MKIIFCLSYLSVPWTLQLIEEKKDTKFIVITNIISISKLISTLYSTNNVLYLEPVEGVFSLNLFKIISNIYKLLNNKISVKKYFLLKNADVYFFYTAFAIFESWMIKKLSYFNNIYYKPVINTDSFIKINVLKNCFKVFEFYLLYQIFFQPLKKDKMIYSGVSKSFLRKIKAKTFNIPNNYTVINTLIKRKFNLDTSKILYLTGGSVECGYILEDEYINKSKNLLKKLTELYGKDSIVLKKHPRYTKKYEFESSFKELPSYTPGNLVMNCFDTVIGFNSALLFEAANNNMKVYSTIKYYTTCDNNFNTNEAIDYFNTNLINNSNIIYFKEFDELEKV